ncbi:MAG: hypothetical protein ABJD07_07385 [Gemmatimonadaceae bacterium]
MRDTIRNGLRATALVSAIAAATLAATACGVDDGFITGVVSSNPNGGGGGTQTGSLSITILAGNNQIADVGRNVNDSLAVTVTRNGVAASGVTVNWTVISGSAIVSSTASTTNGQGVAKTLVAVGALAERSTVRASVTGATVDFALTGRIP